MDPIRSQLAVLARAAALVAGVALATSACSGSEPRTAAAAPPSDPLNPSTPVVDSILPMGVLLARFREGLPVATSLEHGAASADDLVRRFMTAAGNGDTAALADMTLSRAEYGWLYFPTSVYAAAPYELPPEIAWTLSTAINDKGASRVVRRLSGLAIRYHGYSCGQEASEGANRFWRECIVEYEPPEEGRTSRRLFGTIIERDGQYKFLSYANDF